MTIRTEKYKINCILLLEWTGEYKMCGSFASLMSWKEVIAGIGVALVGIVTGSVATIFLLNWITSKIDED